MRIIAGTWRGRRLLTPKDVRIRPTSDRAREALFDILDHGKPPLRGARFLDLFCGTGAVGVEALSRGAAEVLLVDNDAEALQLAKANIAHLGSPPGIRVMAADATRLGSARTTFDLVFLDPPYRSDLAAPTLATLIDGWLAPDALCSVELMASEPFEPPDGFTALDSRKYGKARIEILRWGGESG